MLKLEVNSPQYLQSFVMISNYVPMLNVILVRSYFILKKLLNWFCLKKKIFINYYYLSLLNLQYLFCCAVYVINILVLVICQVHHN